MPLEGGGSLLVMYDDVENLYHERLILGSVGQARYFILTPDDDVYEEDNLEENQDIVAVRVLEGDALTYVEHGCIAFEQCREPTVWLPSGRRLSGWPSCGALRLAEVVQVHYLADQVYQEEELYQTEFLYRVEGLHQR